MGSGFDGDGGFDGGRRRLLKLAAVAPVAMILPASRGGAEDAACFDPNALPSAQKGLRQSLGFKLESPDPQKQCGDCAFFTSSNASCGKCMLLSGGPVTRSGTCSSWSPKR